MCHVIPHCTLMRNQACSLPSVLFSSLAPDSSWWEKIDGGG